MEITDVHTIDRLHNDSIFSNKGSTTAKILQMSNVKGFMIDVPLLQ